MLKPRSYMPKAFFALLLAVAFILTAACCTETPGTEESNTESGSWSNNTDATGTAGSDTETAVSISDGSDSESTPFESDTAQSESTSDTASETTHSDTGTESASAAETETVTESVTETETTAETETTSGGTAIDPDPSHITPTISFTGAYGRVSLRLIAMSYNPALFASQFNLAQKVADDFESTGAYRAEGASHIYSYSDESTSFMIDVAYYDDAGKLLFVKIFAGTYETDGGADCCAAMRVKLNGYSDYTKRKIKAACLSTVVSFLEGEGETVDADGKIALAELVSVNDFLVDGDDVCFINTVGNDGTYVITRVPVSEIDGWQNEKVIALTYDDGPAANTDFILDLLEKEDVRATFFVQGYRVNNETAVSRLLRMKEMGCEIGNHSYDHHYFNKLSDEDVYYQINETNEIIKAATGEECTLLRPPGGFEYSSTQADAIYEKYGIRMHIILWWVDSRDWEYNQMSTMTQEEKVQAIVNTVMKELYDSTDGHYMSGFIVLMHDVHAVTYYASQQLIPALKALGYKFLTVSEIMGYDIDDGTVYDYSAFNFGRDITRRYK